MLKKNLTNQKKKINGLSSKPSKKYKYLLFIISFALFFIFLYYISLSTMIYIVGSLQQQDINYVNMRVTDIFEMVIFGALIYGVMIVAPITLWLIYNKYKAGLYAKERRAFKIFISLYPLSLIGMLFGYLISMLYIIPFFLGYNDYFGANNYILLVNLLRLVCTTMITFAILIQTPTLFILLNKNDIITKDVMKRYRIVFLILSLIIGTALSPPDLFSMFLFGIPIYLGYELSIWV